MAGNGISGKGGDVLLGTGPSPQQVAEVTKWSFNPKSTNPAYRSNRTAGYTTRVQGYKDGSGSIDTKWDPGNPLTAVLDVGAIVTLNLQTIGTQRMVVPAIVDGLKLDVNLESAEIIGCTVDFSTTGSWSYGAATTGLLGPLGGGAAGAAGMDPNGQGVAAAPEPAAPAGPQAGQPPQGLLAGGVPPDLITAVAREVIQMLAREGLLSAPPGRQTQPGRGALAA